MLRIRIRILVTTFLHLDPAGSGSRGVGLKKQIKLKNCVITMFNSGLLGPPIFDISTPTRPPPPPCRPPRPPPHPCRPPPASHHPPTTTTPTPRRPRP